MINPFAVLASAVRRTIRSIFVLVFVTLYAPPEEEPQRGPQEGLQEEPESRSKLIHELQTALAAAGRTYLGGLAGEQTVALVQKAFSQVLNAVAGSLAAGLNVALEYVLQSMQDAGVQLSVTLDKVTPQVVIFGIQCALLALVGYWLLSFVYRLISPPLWRALKMVKKVIALATFGHKGVPLGKLKGPFGNKEKKQKEGKEGKEGKDGKEAAEARGEEKSSFFKLFKKNKKQA